MGCGHQITVSPRMQMCGPKGGGGELGRHGVLVGNKQQAEAYGL